MMNTADNKKIFQHSNTTLVKVKLDKFIPINQSASQIQIQYLLKLNDYGSANGTACNSDSNTILVKVKC